MNLSVILGFEIVDRIDDPEDDKNVQVVKGHQKRFVTNKPSVRNGFSSLQTSVGNGTRRVHCRRD